MSNKLVSIIMGAYNCENSISDCVNSVINQTYTNWEFIICDDCSTDGTWKVLEQLRAKDNRIILIQNERNYKLAASLNNCLKYCKGEYIARMDADDICLPERLEKQTQFLEDYPEYAVVGSSAQIYDGHKITGIRKCKEIPTKDDVLFGPTFIHPSIMMRKTTYDLLGGYTVMSRTQRGQDWDLWFRFFSAGFKGYNIDEPLLIYHYSEEDHKKISFKSACGYTQTAWNGMKILHVPFWKYIYAVKPVLSYFIPEKLKKKRRKEY